MDMDLGVQEQLRCDLISAINDNREEVDSFLRECLKATANPGGNSNALANIIIEYLSRHGIKVVTVAPHQGRPSIVSLFVETDGPALIMNGLIDVESKSSDPSSKPGSNDLDSQSTGTQERRTEIVAGTAATVVAYTHLHARRKQLQGTIVLTIVSNDETGDMGGCHYLLEEDERRELFKGDCVLNAEPTGIDTVVVADTKLRSLANHPLVQGIMRSANTVMGKVLVLVPPEHPTHNHVWSGLGIPTCSLGLPLSKPTTDEESGIDIEDFLSLAKIHALAACDYIMFDQ